MAGVLFASFMISGSTDAAQRTHSRTAPHPAVQRSTTVFDQGYGRGYGEGYSQGQKDWSNAVPRDFKASESYLNRQSVDQRYSSSQEYSQGYDLGFELGYTDAYFGRAQNASVPPNAEVLARAAALADRRTSDSQRQTPDSQRQDVQRQDSQGPETQQPDLQQQDWRRQNDPAAQTRPRSAGPGPLVVPSATEFKIRLQNVIDTTSSRVGDKFSATVMNPSTFESATIDGHISKLKKSGRMTGKTELAFEFDNITTPDGRTAPFKAELVRIYDSDKVKQVDEEGNVETSSRTGDTTKRTGIGAVAGAVLGGIAGGGKGAAIGAVIGAGAGAGTVLIEGDKDLRLEPGTEMLVRTEGSKDRQ
jgi:hypothetical protein